MHHEVDSKRTSERTIQQDETKGGDEVPDSNALKKKIKEYGMSVSELSRRSGICRQTLYNRLDGKGEWKASEVIEISKALRLTKAERESIFLS